jgi:hydrogenase maturation protein HypF
VKSAERWSLGGAVQGVGYRPYIYRLAQSFRLTGWVRNNAGDVEIHAEGPADRLAAFADVLLLRQPPTANAHLLGRWPAELEWHTAFSILSSALGTDRHVTVPLDLASCEDCIAELNDPRARRHRYPFINCTQCGPRYTIIRDLPYDRSNTTLDCFRLCEHCEAEYSAPEDRRFHAQPLACPRCGPTIAWSESGCAPLREAGALEAAVAALRSGRIIALRGIGGYHLLCDASSESAVARLRLGKGRPTKPLALLVPWAGADGLDVARKCVVINADEANALRSASRPIVILRKAATSNFCAPVAPGLLEIGVMLPYSPLHHMLAADFGAPLVATSGNARGEPVLTDPDEARQRLQHIAEGFLHHNRPIARPAEDPVVRFLEGVARPLRMGRGTAPVEMKLRTDVQVPTLAVGAYQKGTVALAWGKRAIVSPHLGDQSTARGRAIFTQMVNDLQRLHGIAAQRVVHDAHPDFPATRWALNCGLPTTAVWHHHAHASAAAGEFSSETPLLCFTWDGIGLGPDKTFWGGEALLGMPGAWRRAASFRPFRLPGGERTARESWRAALSLCWASGTSWPEGEQRGGDGLLREAFDQGLNSPVSTSVGRLFDAAAALTEVCTVSSYEAEAAMRLEALCEDSAPPVSLPLTRDAQGIWRSDWAPLLVHLLDRRQTCSFRAAQFHSSLAHALLDQALIIRGDTRANRVGLAGGVFQNRVLTQHVHALLTGHGFEVLIPSILPLNDAAISFGQLVEASAAHAAA